MESEIKQQFYVSPIAEPISSPKLQKKIYKLTKKCTTQKLIKRGVKEVVKAIKKGFSGICIIAADVSPVDVISHIPLYCESKNIPYCYVRSRVELGIAAQTKKPTSVVLLTDPKKSQIPNEKVITKFNKLESKIRQINKYLA